MNVQTIKQTPWRCFLIVLVLLISSSTARPDELPSCPIMPENQAVLEYHADYDGKRYYFCCEHCVADFQNDPSRFASLDSVKGYPLDKLPSDESSSVDGEAGAMATFMKWADKKIHRYCLNVPLVQWHIVALAIVLLLPLANWIGRGRSQTSDDEGIGKPPRRIVFFWQRGHIFNPILQRVAWVIMLLLVFDTVYLSTIASERGITLYRVLAAGGGDDDENEVVLDDEMLKILEWVHYSTFVDYGFPPRPRRRQADRTLQREYYRGNDERHEHMFNGGQYRTVTFKMQLETEDGDVIQPGTSLAGKTPYLKVAFIRAPHTSSGYFTDEYMSHMFLTAKADRFLGHFEPVADRVDWVSVEPEQVWEARYRLPEGDKFPQQWLRDAEPITAEGYRGVIYLCEDRYNNGKLQAGRYHYGIEYHLQVDNGVVREDSDLFMGSTYHGRAYNLYQITEDQWLSDQPIPEKPE